MIVSFIKSIFCKSDQLKNLVFFSTILLTCFLQSLSSFAQSRFKGTIDSIRLIGEKQIRPGTLFKGSVLGGLSGIDLAPDGSYYIISDDPSENSPSRFYKVNLQFDEQKFDSVEFKEVAYLEQTDGATYPVSVMDGETIRYHHGNLYIASEGSRKKNLQPFLSVYTPAGKYLRNIPLGSQFQYYPTEKGLRHNYAIEGLDFKGAKTNKAWIVNEEPLYQDGPEAQLYQTKSPIRLTLINTKTGKIKKQYAYMLDQVAKAPAEPDAEHMNAVSEILAISDKQLLVLERGFSMGAGNTIKLYLANFSNATNVKGQESLEKSDYMPASKKLLMDLSAKIPYVDNMEGMAFGPVLKHGNPSLIFISDDNFNKTQLTQFVVFKLITSK